MNADRRIVAAVAVIASLGTQAAAAGDGIAARAVNCKLVRTVAQLQAIGSTPGSYCLANDIDLGSVANFTPLAFPGKFFGNGHTIRNLTINTADNAGLFGVVNVSGAVIQDLNLVNVNITSTGNSVSAGGVAGVVGAQTTIARVHVSGKVSCTGESCIAGGIAGWLAADEITVTESSSSAAVAEPVNNNFAAVGGAVGLASDPGTIITRTTATGSVSCAANNCNLGGLVGSGSGLVGLSSASGPVRSSIGGNAGGLIGYMSGADAVVRRSHASGAVHGGLGASRAGGLIGYLDDATVEESYSIGPVSGGGLVGGLIGQVNGTPTVTNAYWDRITSKQMTSAAGLQFSTGEFRAALPPGFGNAWDITKKKSYPFLNDADIDFTAPLATLVKTKKVYSFLPTDQHDPWEYAGASTGANAASLATAYTMIARAIGITKDVASLKGVKIDTYFWDDAAKTTTWQGPVTTRATLGTFAAIAAATALNDSNVIGAMKTGQLVLLRGNYVKGNGTNAKHWLLGTLYTASGNVVGVVVANDPWTGLQVMIDPKTKQVVWPADFPLADFRIDGHQPVTLN